LTAAKLKGLPLRGSVAVGHHSTAGLGTEVFAVVRLELNPPVSKLTDVKGLPLLGAVAVGHNIAIRLSALDKGVESD